MKGMLLFVLFCAATISASAQFTIPYRPKQAQAITAVKNRAAQDGYTNPELTGIATVKGNFPVGAFTINNKFDLGSETNQANDQDKGKASFWGYLVRSAAKPDSSRGYVVVEVPIFGFQVFDAPAGIDLAALPGNFSQSLPMNGDGSPSWMNTDELVTRLRTNTTYMKYRAERLDSMPDYVALGISKVPTPQFGVGNPLWSMVFTGSNAGDFLSCNVHAITGQVECVTSPTGITEDLADNTLSIAPNPSYGSDAISIAVPADVYSPEARIELFNSLGEKVYSFAMSGAGAGHSVIIPVGQYSAGSYFVRYINGGKALTQILTIE